MIARQYLYHLLRSNAYKVAFVEEEFTLLTASRLLGIIFAFHLLSTVAPRTLWHTVRWTVLGWVYAACNRSPWMQCQDKTY